jgi:hypothetical protein
MEFKKSLLGLLGKAKGDKNSQKANTKPSSTIASKSKRPPNVGKSTDKNSQKANTKPSSTIATKSKRPPNVGTSTDATHTTGSSEATASDTTLSLAEKSGKTHQDDNDQAKKEAPKRSILKEATTSVVRSAKHVSIKTTPTLHTYQTHSSSLQSKKHQPPILFYTLSPSDSQIIDLKEACKNWEATRSQKITSMEGKYITYEGNQIAVIKCITPGESKLFLNLDYPQLCTDVAFVAGLINQEDLRVDPEGNLKYLVSIKRNKPKEDFLTFARDNMDNYQLKRGTKPQEFRVVCYCSTPFISEDHAKTIGMKFEATCPCGEKAHSKCLPPQVLQNTSRWECTPCLVRNKVTEGLQWSAPIKNTEGREHSKEKAQNTCPIDNFLTALTIFIDQQNPDLISNFPKDDQHDNLKEIIQLCQKKEFGRAQLKYYKDLEEINHLHEIDPENNSIPK